MVDESTVETAYSLEKIKRVCGLLRRILKVLFVIFCIGWLFAICVIFYSLFDPGTFGIIDNVNVFTILLCLIYGSIAAIMFKVFIDMFSDAAKGDSPFTMGQVKRLRVIAILLVFYAVLESLISLSTPFMQIDQWNSGYAATGDNAIIAINFAPFIAAGVVFAFSFVFKYGVLLQEFSDDAI